MSTSTSLAQHRTTSTAAHAHQQTTQQQQEDLQQNAASSASSSSATAASTLPPTAASPFSSSSSSSTDVTPLPQQKSKRPELGFKHMLAGSLAGMASKTILQPLDLVKVRLQVQDGTGRNEYKGLYDGVKAIVKTDGFRGLYRGLTPNLMASGVSWGVYFFSYNHAKNFWRQYLLRPTTSHSSSSSSASSSPAAVPRLGPFAHLSCAAFSGTLATIVTNPFSMVKTRLQLQGKDVNAGTRLYSGVFDAFIRITREEGVLTLYRGIGPSLVLVSNGALQFMSYEELKRLTVMHLIPSREEKELRPEHFLAIGALAKVFSATVTYPMAVTRARLYQRKPDEMLKKLQQQEAAAPISSSSASSTATTSSSTTSAAPRSSLPPLTSSAPKHVDAKYDGMIDVIGKIWRHEGPKGFYRGLVPMLLKTTPSSAITFLVYETAIKVLHAEPMPKKQKEY